MSRVRELVDPNKRLPRVELSTKSVGKSNGLCHTGMAIIAGGDEVGRCNIVQETYPYTYNRVAHFDGVEIKEDARGRGIGIAAYILCIEFAHERRLPFQSQDSDISPDAKRIWEKLARLGVAEIIEPFWPSPDRPGVFSASTEFLCQPSIYRTCYSYA